jgi:hypothetical protein
VHIKKATSAEETAPSEYQRMARADEQNRNTSEVSPRQVSTNAQECIVYTWDYHSSTSVWNSLRTQPILADEVQTFKSLIVVHKLLQEGHPVVSPRTGSC